jgi:hypothetical protein
VKRLATAVVAVAIAGCGGAGTPTARPVVQAWTDAIRTHDYAAANSLFALPTELLNGVRVHATIPAEIDVFNRSLPCGAVLVDTEPTAFGRTLATFRLVPGPGGACKGTAQVTFRIVKGHIVEWLRKDNPKPLTDLQET